MDIANETFLWDRISTGRSPRDIISSMLVLGMIRNSKQAWRTLEKWAKKGLYDYGVSLDLGWKVA
ncbi:hypothetical protein LCGC14_2336310 [marine sediment metagenome]|uniref:Uncharacterized protein n=1 Tax=marine sediment metagenome TaxID=412755 RepID=A0A0F9CDC6_9ZZZZ